MGIKWDECSVCGMSGFYFDNKPFWFYWFKKTKVTHKKCLTEIPNHSNVSQEND